MTLDPRPKRKRDLTPKVLANFSPGFPTLGQSASTELLTLKEFPSVLNSFRVNRILTALLPRVGNPGLKLANSFGVKFNSDSWEGP